MVNRIRFLDGGESVYAVSAGTTSNVKPLKMVEGSLENLDVPNNVNIDYEPIWKAIVDRNTVQFHSSLEVVKNLPGFDVDHVYLKHYEMTCLHLACAEGFDEFVEILLIVGANPNKINQDITPLHLATQNKHLKVMELLLKDSRTRVNITAGGRTALHVAVKDNYLEGVQLLLSYDADPNLVNFANYTAFHWAVRKKLRQMVELMIERSKFLVVDMYKDVYGKTALDYLLEGFPKIQRDMKKLVHITKDADPQSWLNEEKHAVFLDYLQNKQPDKLTVDGSMLLTKLVTNGFHSAVKIFINRIPVTKLALLEAAKVAVRKGDHHMLKILFTSAHNSILKCGELLCVACSALALSSCTENPEIDREECVKIILEQSDLSVRYADGKGNTPLHYAVRANNKTIVKSLVKRGGDIFYVNKYGFQPSSNMSKSTWSEVKIQDIYHSTVKSHDKSQPIDQFRAIEHHSTGRSRVERTFMLIAVRRWKRSIHYVNGILYILFYITLIAQNIWTIWMCVDSFVKFTSLQNANGKESLLLIVKWKNIWDFNWTDTVRPGYLLGLIFFAGQKSIQLVKTWGRCITDRKEWQEIAIVLLGAEILNCPNVYVDVLIIPTFTVIFVRLVLPPLTWSRNKLQMMAWTFGPFILYYIILRCISFILAFLSQRNTEQWSVASVDTKPEYRVWEVGVAMSCYFTLTFILLYISGVQLGMLQRFGQLIFKENVTTPKPKRE